MSSAATRNATSTFAAITCCSTRLPGAFRENTPRRGKTQCNMARSSPTISAATQSPTAGQAASPSTSAMPRSLPEGSAQHSPNSLAILHSPRCCEITRAGFAVSSSPENRSFQNASKYPSQPKSSKSTRAPSCRKRGNRHRVRENAMRQRDLPERANEKRRAGTIASSTTQLKEWKKGGGATCLRSPRNKIRRHTRPQELRQRSSQAPPKQNCGSTYPLPHSIADPLHFVRAIPSCARTRQSKPVY